MQQLTVHRECEKVFVDVLGVNGGDSPKDFEVVCKETNALLCETETLKKVEKVRRSNVSQTSVKPNTGPSAWTHHNGHKNCEAELAQKTKSRHLPLVLKNRFDSLLTVENEDKIATCRALCV